MAFDLNQIGGYGTGELGDIEISDGAVQNLNSYARVTAIDGNTVTIDIANMNEGGYETFRAGNDVLIHVSATNGTDATLLGSYVVAKITLVSNGVLTLDKPAPAVDLNYHYVQAVTFLNADCLTLKTGAVITPPPYDPFKFIGGIVAIKCWDTLEFAGGCIDLRDCGIPANRKNALRPLTTQETAANGEGDNAKFSGWENHITASRFLLNAGDGAAFIVSKKIICSDDARIGNPATHGAQFCRGAANSVGVKPSNITNIGGSTILIAADIIENFTPKIVAKYRSTDKIEGRGLCRAYIASNTTLRNDEGLYAFDRIANPRRVQQTLGVNDFGNGSFGDLTNPTAPLNNYASVKSIGRSGCLLNYETKTLNGLAPLTTGSLALIQNISNGKIVIARVLNDTGTAFIIDKKITTTGAIQIVSVPEFDNLTITTNYTGTAAFNGDTGGVFAVAVKNTLDLTGGKINVEGKGGAPPYGADGLAYLGNSQNSDRLPLGEGHGSVFILAKNIITDANSRIGASYSGDGKGGRFGGNNSDGTNQGGGYSGAFDENRTGSGGGYIGGGAAAERDSGGLGGSGAAGGTTGGTNELDRTKIAGGYGSNGRAFGNFNGGSQGAHVMIIADRANLVTANISTGGEGGHGIVDGISGAAGYGGGGSAGGSSGGGAGAAFVYVNDSVE